MFFSNFVEIAFLSGIKYIGILIILLIYYFLFKNLFMYSIQYYFTHFLFSFKKTLYMTINNIKIDNFLEDFLLKKIQK